MDDGMSESIKGKYMKNDKSNITNNNSNAVYINNNNNNSE